MSVSDIAYVVATMALGEDIEPSELKQIVRDTFAFDIPLVDIGNGVFSLELFHGPTLAFKDVGARFLARIISHFADSGSETVNVLVATSGDSGGAVAAGFHRVPGVRVFVLYPERGLSAVQRYQFSSLGDNIYPIEVRGTFDDCQRVVKEAFVDQSLRERMPLTSANSINICRLLPQTFYYFYGYSQLMSLCREQHGGVVISVPCGNLGNLTAGLLAKKMGLPVKRFIVANNVNDPFKQYLSNGSFIPLKPVRTMACAMDVGNPSNFSRIMDIYGGDFAAISRDMKGYSYSDSEITETMREVYSDFNYVMDPHGATAYRALKEDLTDGEKGFFLSTAHPSKFPRTMRQVLNLSYPDYSAKTVQTPPNRHEVPRITPSIAALKKILFATT